MERNDRRSRRQDRPATATLYRCREARRPADGKTRLTSGAATPLRCTNALAEDRFATLLLDLVAVKGKTEPEKIYALLGPTETRSRDGFAALRHAHEQILAAYAGRSWTETLALLQKSAGLYAEWGLDTLWSIYEERVKQYLEAPPPEEWDGVYRLRTK